MRDIVAMSTEASMENTAAVIGKEEEKSAVHADVDAVGESEKVEVKEKEESSASPCCASTSHPASAFATGSLEESNKELFMKLYRAPRAPDVFSIAPMMVSW